MPAVALTSSPSCSTNGCVKKLHGVFSRHRFSLNTLNTGSPDTLSLVIVIVMVSSLLLSSLTSIDFTRAVVDAVGGVAVSSVDWHLVYLCGARCC